VLEACLTYKRHHHGKPTRRTSSVACHTDTKRSRSLAKVVFTASGGGLRNRELLHRVAGGVDTRNAAATFTAPTSSGSLEFLFSRIIVFSFIPAFLAGLMNARFKQRVAQFVWLVPALILGYKFATFPASSVLQSQFSAAFHQYFGGGFLIPEFRDWSDFWSVAGSNPDMARGMAQLDTSAPFYAGVGYSVAAWIGCRTDLNRKVLEKMNHWEQARFKHHEQ
jgi:hypothetical protein